MRKNGSRVHVFIACFCFYAVLSAQQKASLQITVVSPYLSELSCYKLAVLQSGDTIYKTDFTTQYNSGASMYFEVDSLVPGTCTVKLQSCSARYSTSAELDAKSGHQAELTLSIPEAPKYYAVDSKSWKPIETKHPEGELSLSYLGNGWLEHSAAVNNAFSIGITPYFWQSVAKHLGFMEGIGWGWSYYGIKLDNSRPATLGSKQITRFYSYGFLNLNAKMRLGPGNQKNKGSNNKLYFDLGCSYYIPVFFLDINHYSGNKRSFEGGLHQFTDLRCFANLGWKNVYLFTEYRLFDFVLGNRPEVFRCNAGIRITGLVIN